MIASINLTSVGVTLDRPTRRYVEKRIGMLDKYLPRRARSGVRADVRLKRVDRDHGNKYEAEVLLHTVDGKIVARDSTLNVLAALDIVRAKLLAQMKRAHDRRVDELHRRPER